MYRGFVMRFRLRVNGVDVGVHGLDSAGGYASAEAAGRDAYAAARWLLPSVDDANLSAARARHWWRDERLRGRRAARLAAAQG